jgi:hypothetical protein
MFNYSINNYCVVTFVLKNVNPRTGIDPVPETRVNVKVNISYCRPEQTLKASVGSVSHNFLHSQYTKVVRSAVRTGRLYSPRGVALNHFCQRPRAIVRSEGLWQRKIRMIQLRIEPATSQLIAAGPQPTAPPRTPGT